MSSARFMRQVTVAGKQVNIYVAEEIRQAGIRRSIDAIDPALLRDTVNKVAIALVGNELLSEAQQDQTKHVTITSMPHESPADPNNHSTIEIQNDKGATLAKGHVTTDPSKQQAAR